MTRKAPKREGPFLISEVLNPLNYRLSLPKSWHIHPVFHVTLLSPFKHTEVHGENFPQPPPDLIDEQPESEVEAILAHQKSGRSHKYLIKWKGYATAENSWEPEKNLSHSKEILNAYKTRHKLHSRIN